MKSQTKYQSISNEVIKTSQTFKQDELQKNNKQMKKFNYQGCFFLQQDDINFIEISPNEQILAYGVQSKLIMLNIVNKKVIKEIEFDNYIWICRFSNYSNFIFIGDGKGYIFQLDIQQDFKQIYKNKLHDHWIDDLKIINNQQVLSCSDRHIVVTDVKDEQQLLNLRHAHEDYIYQLEYDQIKNLIISCSRDKSIKFFQMNGNLFINQQNAHNGPILQIQLINSNRNLLSRTDKQFKKWKIDYNKKLLKQTKTFIEKKKVYGFFFAQNYQILIKTYPNYLLILDNKFKVIKKQKHQIENFYAESSTNQPISLNYLLIKGLCIYLFKNNRGNISPITSLMIIIKIIQFLKFINTRYKKNKDLINNPITS